MQFAERHDLPPWECCDEPTPRWFWVKASNLVAAAEAAARKTREFRQRALAAHD